MFQELLGCLCLLGLVNGGLGGSVQCRLALYSGAQECPNPSGQISCCTCRDPMCTVVQQCANVALGNDAFATDTANTIAQIKRCTLACPCDAFLREQVPQAYAEAHQNQNSTWSIESVAPVNGTVHDMESSQNHTALRGSLKSGATAENNLEVSSVNITQPLKSGDFTACMQALESSNQKCANPNGQGCTDECHEPVCTVLEQCENFILFKNNLQDLKRYTLDCPC